ncbi:MAG: sugar-binding protein [Bacteroidota bacterium]
MKTIQRTLFSALITALISFHLQAQGIIIGSGTTFSLGGATLSVPNNWSNSGTFIAGNDTVIFNGATGNQTIANGAGETFNNIRVNKAAGNVQLLNNITVNGTLIITDGDVDLNGHNIMLGTTALLLETPGNTVKGTSGTISTTRTLGANPGNVAGLGLNISSSPALGSTTIARGHAVYTNGSFSSIGRSYNVAPAANSSLNATVVFHFDDSELNGLTKSQLTAWASTNSGTSWSQVGGTVDIVNNTVTVTGINAFSLLTLATGETPVIIVVDGLKDEFYTSLTGPNDGYLQLKSYAFNDNGIPTSDADLSAKVWAAWDNEWFYLYEEVMDDTVSGSAPEVWNNDCIELKIDPQPTDSVTNSIWDTRLTALGAGGGVVAWDNMDGVSDSQKQWSRRTIPGGYALELAVKWSAIQNGSETITPAVDNIFGMSIHQEENDGHGRQATIQWAAVLLNEAWETPKYLGTVKFLADHKLQFIPTNNMTGRTNPVPYDGTPFYMRIDALKDPFYYSLTGPNSGYLQIRSYSYNGNGPPVNDADLSAKVWTAWDNQWFYLYEEVMDDTISGNAANVWEEDEIEVNFDPQPTDSVTNSVWQTRLTALGTAAGVLAGDSLNGVSASEKQWARKIIPSGYALELAIKWSAIYSGSETITPAVNNIFGMAISQHDNDGHARRQATIQWAAVLSDAVYNTPKYHGTVKFLADNKLQFIPTNNMTGRTNPIPYDGSNYTPTGIENASTMIPEKFSLGQNYPNPFNPQTTIEFAIPKQEFVTLKIYNSLGQDIVTLVNRELNAGYYKTTWNVGSEPSGVYFYRLQGGSFTETKRLVLLK